MMTGMNLDGIWNGVSFSLPMTYWALALGALALCLIWGRYKLGLAWAFGVLVYWGFLANRTGIMKFIEGDSMGMLAAVFVGLSMVLLAMVALIEEIQ